MAALRANRLLAITALAVGGLALLAFLASDDDDGRPGSGRERNNATADADTPKETVETLVAQVKALRKENSGLLQTLADRERTVDDTLEQQRRLTEAQQEKRDARLTDVVKRLDDLVRGGAGPAPGENDLPVGLGLEVGDAYHWVEPLGRLDATGIGPHGKAVPTSKNAQRGAADTLLDQTLHGPLHSGAQATTLTPRYTVPKNATLLDGRAMTALVGRIPVRGQIRDPMEFKIITGAENLAANGFTLPDLHGMVWSGTAVGDWTLACVRGRLTSVTFIFDDGTVRTVDGDDNAPLGWISDPRGYPCIAGQRVSNAGAYLLQRLASGGVKAAADAAAAVETTTTFLDSGGARSAVSGDAGRYIAGKFAAGSLDQLTQWLIDRQEANFDAVYTEPGQTLAIHVSQEIRLDHDHNGRKLDHAMANAAPALYIE